MFLDAIPIPLARLWPLNWKQVLTLRLGMTIRDFSLEGRATVKYLWKYKTSLPRTPTPSWMFGLFGRQNQSIRTRTRSRLIPRVLSICCRLLLVETIRYLTMFRAKDIFLANRILLELVLVRIRWYLIWRNYIKCTYVLIVLHFHSLRYSNNQ